jgi:hypothetical protein
VTKLDVASKEKKILFGNGSNPEMISGMLKLWNREEALCYCYKHTRWHSIVSPCLAILRKDRTKCGPLLVQLEEQKPQHWDPDKISFLI